MGLLSTIGSLAPTIGTIIGKLLGGNSIEAGVVTYDFSFVRKDQEAQAAPFTATFGKDGDDFILFNQSVNSSDCVTMSTPAQGDLGPETITVPGRQSFTVTPVFARNAEMDNSKVELTASSGGSFKGGVEAGDSAVCVSASASNVSVGDKKEHRIGTYLYVTLDENKATLISKGVNMTGISSLTLHGAGDSIIKISNVESSAPVSTIAVDLPGGLIIGDTVSVNVSAEVASLKQVMQLGLNTQCKPISDELLRRLSSAKKLNV